MSVTSVGAPFALLTDGTCTLPAAAYRDLDIAAAPLHVAFGRDMFTSGPGGDLPHERFYELIAHRPERPTTSQPSPSDWGALYAEAEARGERDVLVITIASAMSGTYQTARLAKGLTAARVEVVDSRTNSAGQGLIVRAVGEARRRGCTFDEAVALANRLAGGPTIYAYVDTLEYLRRSGRVPALAAVFGSLLSIKPIVRIFDGRTESIGRARSRPAALELVKRYVLGEAVKGQALAVGIAHTNAPAMAAELADWARVELAAGDVFCQEAGPVLAAHVGPGTVAIAMMKELS